MVKESRFRIFLRFLKFGCLAWGGPVPQIAMMKEEMVEKEKWLSRERFNRVLAVYQALPGPEAHELAVYFGMLSGGRWGAVLAGLGFMLPGFILMLLLSWLYTAGKISSHFFEPIFFGFQPAVVALLMRGLYKIGQHALLNGSLWAICILSAAATFLNVHFLLVLPVSGLIYFFWRRRKAWIALGIMALAFSAFFAIHPAESLQKMPSQKNAISPGSLTAMGLRAGLLTFGGAYTAIPLLRKDAVTDGGWMSNQQFMDGLALSGILPAPLIIFSTFVGFLGGGTAGAAGMTLGIFLPSFLFTLIGHKYLERILSFSWLHDVLDGVTAAVVGIIVPTAVSFFQTGVKGLSQGLIFALSLLLILSWKSKLSAAVAVLLAGSMGFLLK